MNALSEALQSGSILLREGLEALLVIAALAAFLTRAGEAYRTVAATPGVVATYEMAHQLLMRLL